MIKEKIYTYLGVNGTIVSPVFLEGVYSVRKLRLTADKGKMLTNGEKVVPYVIIPETDLVNWTEIDK